MSVESTTPEARSILLVEDEAANRVLVRAIAVRAMAQGVAPFELHEAASLGEARAMVVAQHFDVILLDVRLPDGIGLDLASEVRAGPPDKQPLIIVLSASVHGHDRQRAIEAGADLFLPKPLKPDVLIDVLRRTITRAPATASSSLVQPGTLYAR